MKQRGLASFQARKKDDTRTVKTIAGWLKKARPHIRTDDVSDDPAYWEQDIDLVCQIDGHRLTIEVKADQLATTTGNLFLETVSVEAKPSPGWLALTKADLLFYYCAPPPAWAKSPYCKTDSLYIFVTERLREWFLAERQRLLHTPPRTDRKQAAADKKTFDKRWRIRATHTTNPETGGYQHTTLGWTVSLEYVKDRYFQDTYGQRGNQMQQLMIIANVPHHLDTLAEMLQRYVTWAKRR